MLTPSNHREFLFSDLLYPKLAAAEHAVLVSLLRDVFGAEVLYFEELLVEALNRANSMDRLLLFETVSQIEGLGPRDTERLVHVLAPADAPTAARCLIAGQPRASEHASVSEFLTAGPYHLPPVPNLMLLRDAAAVVSDDMFVAWSSQHVRRRENLLWRFVLQHSRLHSEVRWHNWMLDDADSPGQPLHSLDGGNLVQPAPDVVVLGQSLRTGPGAVEKLTARLAERAEKPTHIFVVRLPDPLHHLDSVFTMLSPDECAVFPPAVFGHGPESVNVLHVTVHPGGEATYSPRANLVSALSEVLGRPLQAVRCGGTSPLYQRREQWWGGASMLAAAPATVLCFQSAQYTVAELAARDYRSVEAEALLAGSAALREDEKCVVLLPGSELSRAGGGPRSLVLPLIRE